MKDKTIKISFSEALRFYKSDDSSIKELALRAYSKDELEGRGYKNIKTFSDACEDLGLDYEEEVHVLYTLRKSSLSIAACYILNIVFRALNRQVVHFGSIGTISSNYFQTWYPHIIMAKPNDIVPNSVKLGITPMFDDDYITYMVEPNMSEKGVNMVDMFEGDVKDLSAITSLIACSTEDMANHAAKYFWKFIVLAQYGDIDLRTGKMNFHNNI